MSRELTADVKTLEHQLIAHEDLFDRALQGRGLSKDRLMSTIIMAGLKNPKILQANRQSLLNSAMTAAVLALEADGRQGALIPYKGNANFVPMYQGYVTLAGRAAFSLQGQIVREKDIFKVALGTHPSIVHEPKLGGKDRKMIGVYAVARHAEIPPLVRTMHVDEVLEHRRKYGNKVWNEHFDEMARKTPMRLLSKDIPDDTLSMASRMEYFSDTRGHAFITPDQHLIVDGEVQLPGVPSTGPEDQPATAERLTRIYRLHTKAETREYPTPEDWAEAMERGLKAQRSVKALDELWARNHEERQSAEDGDLRRHVEKLEAVYHDKRSNLQEKG